MAKVKLQSQMKNFLLLLACAFFVSCDKTVVLPGGAVANQPGGTENQNRLAAAVRAFGEPSASGKRSSFICALSEQHLSYMISAGGISHDNFNSRSKQIQNIGGNNTSEIVASNCGNRTATAAAAQCVKQWNESPPHKESMDKYWNYYCYSMRQSSNNCFYCIGLFSNGKLTRD